MSDMGFKTKLVLRNAIQINSAEDAKQVLLNVSNFRSFWETLQKYSKDPDLQKLLTEGMMKNSPERNRDTVSRNVRNWKNKKTGIAISRDTAIELAFILGLNLQDADDFLAAVTESGFRWRNPDEIVFAYAILHGMDYSAALELRRKIGGVEADADRLPAQDENLTEVAYQRLLDLKSETELKNYLRESAAVLGTFHNAAFMQFEKMYRCLEDPELDEGVELNLYTSSENSGRDVLKEKKLSARDILQMYLFRRQIPTRTSKQEKGKSFLDRNQEIVLKNIVESWPDETTLSKMRGREQDITRKVLILLFLATDGGKNGAAEDDEFDEYAEYDEHEPTRFEVFKSSWDRMNLMLDGCGFNKLDPRVPFDWIVFYVLNVDETYETDEKMTEILENVFGGNDSKNPE